MKQARILIIDNDEEARMQSILNKQSGFAITSCKGNVDIAFTLAERHQPDIILFRIDPYGEEGFQIAEAFALEFAASSLILMSSADNKRVLRHALKIGAKDVVNLPVEPDKLINTLYQVLKSDMKRRELFSVQKKTRPQFKIITVFSTKGGVGKSTIALNLAIAMQQISNSRIVLLDMDLFAGNLALMAGVPSKPSVRDIIDDIHSLDTEMVDDYCVSHPSGLKIIPAPAEQDFSEFIQAEHIESTLKLLSQVFNYVVVDAPTSFSDTVIPALELAGDIILVTTPDLASIQNLQQGLDLLTRLSMLSKARIVVNRAGYSGHLKIKDLEKQLGMAIFGMIPNCEKEAIEAVNLGEPLLLLAKNSPAVPKYNELAQKIMSPEKKAGLSKIKDER